ncbi:MAG TPA: hypothetical protein VF291_04705 [Burkholderiaceae bacterium]
MEPTMKKRFPCLAALAAAALVAACATPARVEQMVAQPAAAVEPASPALKGNVSVRDVTGGRDTNPAWMSSVGSSEFQRALEQSLRAAGLLAENRQGGGYFVVADLQKLDQPYLGASLTVSTTVSYHLVERATGKDVYARVVVAPYTAEWNAAFFYNDRLRIANEGAMKANIARLVDDLLLLKLAEAGTR